MLKKNKIINYLKEQNEDSLMDKIDLLNKIRQEYEVSFYLEVVPTVYAENSAPCLAPTLDIIDFCHSTRTEMQKMKKFSFQ